MNLYGTTQCVTNLGAYAMVGKNMQEQKNWISFSNNTNLRTEGQHMR